MYVGVRPTPRQLEEAYRNALVPFGYPGGIVVWEDPDPRAIIELDEFHVGRTTRSVWRKRPFTIRLDADYEAVLHGCADRERTWLTPALQRALRGMHEAGISHSVEAWRDGELVGGLYVVTIGAACMGESMFHEVSEASKMCLIALVERLRELDYAFLDVQYQTDHLERFGAAPIPREEYHARLEAAMDAGRRFVDPGDEGLVVVEASGD